MLRIPVDSSDVISIGYDTADRLLEVEFHGGRVYRYRNVEPEIHAQFMKADSHGQFLFSYINGHYRYEKVAEGTNTTKADKIAFVTGSAVKAREFAKACEVYGVEVEHIELPIDEIQSDDAEDIAVKKAKYAYATAKRPLIVNDSYWNILALRGFPGAYMSSVAQWLRAEDFLRLMEGKSDRTIILTDTVVYYDGKRAKAFSKDYAGTLISEPRGEGLSINQITMMEGQSGTIAEASVAGERSLQSQNDVFHDMAKWLRLQKRLGK
ncbi:MAG TPA: non-canonical purine NTP pyrophosphatase [Candidatus Saccharimonadales bacterium]